MTVFKVSSRMPRIARWSSQENLDRLVQYYSPILHRLGSSILTSFAKPRLIPLADNFVIENAKENGAADFTVLNRLKEKDSVLDTIDMAAECLDHMAAGIDTTGDVLCFLMWELSQPRSTKYQRLLREEFRSKPDAHFDELPMLDAVLNEGLRCFPAIPMSLPRYVPHGGRVIDGFSLPEKSVVSCQALSVHESTIMSSPSRTSSTLKGGWKPKETLTDEDTNGPSPVEEEDASGNSE
jgi:cytochrome P450